MRLFEFGEEEQPTDQPTDDSLEQQPDDTQEVEDPLTSDVDSLMLRLEASDVQKVKLEDFIEELNNMMNVSIDQTDPDQVNSVKEAITKTGKAHISGNYILVNYETPSTSDETKTQKIAMKNVQDDAS